MNEDQKWPSLRRFQERMRQRDQADEALKYAGTPISLMSKSSHQKSKHVRKPSRKPCQRATGLRLFQGVRFIRVHAAADTGSTAMAGRPTT